MGAWGGKLYQDDYALDLKETLNVLYTMPISGDELLNLLKDSYGDHQDISEEDGSTFWLVVADQFEKKGMRGQEVFKKAIGIIETEIDIKCQIDRDMNPLSIEDRKNELDKLLVRLKDPQPEKEQKKKRLPPMLVQSGEIYSFPTMNAVCFNPNFKCWEDDEFNPTGWGAIIVLMTGRLYDYFPWMCYSPLYVNQSQKPTFDLAIQTRLIGQGLGDSHGYFNIGVPKSTHFKKIPLNRLGRVDFDPSKCSELVQPYITQELLKWNVHSGISVCNHCYNLPRPGDHRISGNTLELGLELRAFIKS